MDAPNKVQQLVELFERNLDAYRSGRYKEAQLRKEFIDPFFIALGWDANNEKGYAEAGDAGISGSVGADAKPRLLRLRSQ